MSSNKFFKRLLLSELFDLINGDKTIEDVKKFFKQHNLDPPPDGVLKQVKDGNIRLDSAMSGIQALIETQLVIQFKNRRSTHLVGV